MAATKEAVLGAAREFVTYINRSPSPFHAVEESQVLLKAAGFKELKETEHWNIKPDDKCFVTRNKSTILAFAVGGQYKPGNGYSIVGAHTDSPCLKVKPVSRRIRHGYMQVGVQCYGGGTWHTWFDRDLKVAGRVMVKNGGSLEHHLVHIDRPILRLPNIAIHLHRELSQEFKFNKETHFAPILATCAAGELNNTDSPADSDCTEGQNECDKHAPVLIKLLCDELNVKPEQITDMELCLADCNDATIGGAVDEFIFAPRLDNLISCYGALKGLIASCSPEGGLKEDTRIRMISLFDNEEVGSASAQGAGSSFQELVLRRLSSGGHSVAYEEAIAKSLMVSCDVSHVLHPNYTEKHEEQHKPAFHKGVVVKHNANQRYATTAITTSLIREVASRAGVPLQDFVIRNDLVCGSTIGPIMAAKLGIPVVDIGSPLMSMHSIREMSDTTSVLQLVTLFQTFFESYTEVFASLKL